MLRYKMESSKKIQTLNSILSELDKLKLNNHLLLKQNQFMLNRLHEIESTLQEEQQKWEGNYMNNYIKEHNLEPLLEMLDID